MQPKKNKIIECIIICLFTAGIIAAIVLSSILLSKNKELDDLKDQNTQIEQQLDNLE